MGEISEKSAQGSRRIKHPKLPLVYQGLDDDYLQPFFSPSEARLLNPVSMHLCHFAKEAKDKFWSDENALGGLGIYLLANVYPIEFAKEPTALVENVDRLSYLDSYYSLVPPMRALGATASMMAALMGRILGATGPLLTFSPSREALDLGMDQVRIDLRSKRIDSAVIGLAWTWTAPLDQNLSWIGEPEELVRIHFCKGIDEKMIDQIQSVYMKDLLRIEKALEGVLN